MSTLRFRSVIEITGINPYVLVSAVHAAQLQDGWRKPLPVLVRVNGAPNEASRINLMPIGDGSFYLYLDGEIRGASNTQVGDAVDVELRFDDQYKGGPTDPMPPWFDDALDQNPDARQGWEALTPSRKKEILRYFARLKSSSAKTRNVEKAVHVLSGGPGRFMARSWND